MKKNNTAEKAILDAEAISNALKEGTQNTLKDIMTEAINRMVKESEGDDEEDEDSFEVEDVKTEEENVDDNKNCKNGNCNAEDGQDDDSENDEWSDMEQYKVGDNDYDFTGVDGDELLKVYNKLGDDDKIFVKKTEDGNYEVSDEETGAEYVIELNGDADSEVEPEMSDNDEMEFDIDIEDGGDGEGVYDEMEIEFDDNSEEPEFEYDDEDDDEEMVNEENLGYTTTYQKDVMPGLKMNEPANKKATYSMDGGAPEGNSRPYSGYENKKSNLFTQKVNEDVDEILDIASPNISLNNQSPGDIMETNDFGGFNGGFNGATSSLNNSNSGGAPSKSEAPISEDGSGFNTKRSTKHSSNHINKNVYNQRHSHENGQYTELKESMRKMINKAREIQNENKQYADALSKIKKSLNEAAVLNVTLAQVVKLLSENTATLEEKKSIVERFKSVKNINESKNLYNTIKRELNENKKQTVVIESQISMNDKNTLNETTMYQKQGNPSLSLWDRMENLYTK